MMSRPLRLAMLIALSFLASGEIPAAQGFIINPAVDPWLVTASGTRTRRGDPVTFTWSFVPDGTSIVDAGFGNMGTSDLIQVLDAEFGGDPNNDDLSQRPWFHLFADSFGRWSELSGATYIYEPNDDGATAASSSPPGVLDVRGDIRIAGSMFPPSAAPYLAFNNFPENGGDMVIDTNDIDSFGEPANNNRFLRNTLMHEHGHGIGLRHVASTTDQMLMRTSISTVFDGPRLDEVRGIQYYFGDANEKSNAGLGNESSALATDLGSLPSGSTVSVGSDANVPTQAISPSTTDYVSIANLDDVDFFSFSVSQHSKLSVVLTPRGGQFTQAAPAQEGGGTPSSFDASARSDLTLTIFSSDGTSQLALANNLGLGGVESLDSLDLPTGGEYFARITGAQDTVQLYELALSAIAIQPADFDEDGDVDNADLDIWELAYSTTNLGDADEDGDSDGSDFLLWQQQFTGDLNLSLAVSQPVPEPGLMAILLPVAAALPRRRRAAS